MSSIKVIQLIHGQHFGGAEKVVFQLATHLQPPEFVCEVICLSEGRLLTMLRDNDVAHHFIPMHAKLDFSVVLSIASILKKRHIDITHSHTGRTNLLARLSSILYPVKKLVTVQSPVLMDTNRTLRYKKINYLVERLSARWSDFFVCVSEEGKRNLLAQGVSPEKVDVIYNGADFSSTITLTPAEKKTLRFELGLDNRAPVVGMIAQLRPRKGAEYFIRAVPEIKKRIPESRFLVVGDAEFVIGRDYSGELKQLAEELGVSDVIKFTGFRPDADRIMEILDVLVLPSLFGEGLPLVLLEGMAHGLPIVATRTSGNIEVVLEGENGFLVDAADASSLAHSILTLLLSDELRHNFGEKGKERAQQKFSLDLMIEGYKKIYRALMKKS